MSDSEEQILEPPGTITIVGGGPLGLEAALYGRFLGYDVTLMEANTIGASMLAQADQPLSMLPDRCLSPLALSALNAQNHESPPLILPTTVGQRVEKVLVALTETDLLRGRVRCDAKVVRIEHSAIQSNEEDVSGGNANDGDQSDGDLPPDFRLTVESGDAVESEAVILAIGDAPDLDTSFDLPCPYLYRIGQEKTDDAEHDFIMGLKQIVELYAKLADRESLDLYRPIRGTQPSNESTG
ncbi:FAD/NAD(P)-binding oxidoreductase [Planctomycetes bacterium K23_9]|uniref:FAD/NAD(P)-binding domain-containing protein n=1 Tax=Stieleria marina TaxID=1930275 RepID=A0A517NN88_9BACT|nr:hypothetical protein K239x_05320 [Planctomycetes bacterium K23_9]